MNSAEKVRSTCLIRRKAVARFLKMSFCEHQEKELLQNLLTIPVKLIILE